MLHLTCTWLAGLHVGDPAHFGRSTHVDQKYTSLLSYFPTPMIICDISNITTFVVLVKGQADSFPHNMCVHHALGKWPVPSRARFGLYVPDLARVAGGLQGAPKSTIAIN